MIDEDFEAAEARAPLRAPDAVSLAVGSPHYVRSHRLGSLCIQMPMGHSPRLSVSRYYWDMESPVAVDFRRELRFGAPEVIAKEAYCQERKLRYVLVEDSWDGEGVEAALLIYQPEAKAAQESAALLTAPRRRRSP